MPYDSGVLKTNRAGDFDDIASKIDAERHGAALLKQADSLEVLRQMPDSSVSLICTDPPYHTTKKSNIYGDTAFKEDEHFLEWMEDYFKEWRRILRVNGTIYLFCSSDMAARLEVTASKYLRPINHITWTKPNLPGYDGWKGKMNKSILRRWYPHSERILVFEQGSYGSLEAYRRSPLGQYLLDCRKHAGITTKTLTELIGAYGAVNHGGAVSNWEAGRNIPSREQYRKMAEALESIAPDLNMLAYEDIVRPFDVQPGAEFLDVWDFMSVRPFADKHPAEKPQDMLTHIIRTASYPGDIVLDCFAGSGSTGVAAVRLARRAVVIDIDEQWVDRARREIKALNAADGDYNPVRRPHQTKPRSSVSGNSLFD